MVYVIPFIFIVAVNYFLTNTPRVFHVETTHKWLFPRCFNVEYMWCVCRVSSNLQDLFVSCLHKTFISYHCFWKMIYLTSNCSKFSMFLMVTHSYKSFLMFTTNFCTFLVFINSVNITPQKEEPNSLEIYSNVFLNVGWVRKLYLCISDKTHFNTEFHFRRYRNGKLG